MTFRHVVMWTMRGPSESERAQQRDELVRRLRALPALIPQIRSFEVGAGDIRPLFFDVVLVSEFDDEQGLQAYVTSPAHVEVIDYVREFTSDRAAVDYVVS